MRPVLQREREPYMAFMLSSSSHHPYTLPQEYKSLQLGDLEGTLVGDYLHAIHYSDQQLGAFVDWLRESGILDRSVLVIYGDHQGFLGGQAELPQLLGFDAWNEYHHFQVVKRTPVLIRLPGGMAAGDFTGTSSHLDVAPTVLSLLGIDNRASVMLGRDLTRPGQSLAVFGEGSDLAALDDPWSSGSAALVDPATRTDALRITDRHALSEAATALRDRLVRRHEAAGVSFLLPATSWIDVDVHIGADTMIYPGCVLEGATSIGAECVIGPYSRIVEATIGDGVELKGWNYVSRVTVRNHAVLEAHERRATD
jgi:hypothetical protein